MNTMFLFVQSAGKFKIKFRYSKWNIIELEYTEINFKVLMIRILYTCTT